jgi:hypothetical protein
MLAGDLAVAWGCVRTTPGPLGDWQRGWVLAAQGRYGAALDALAAADHGEDLIAAAASVTRASLLRQIGLHGRAQLEDDSGLARLAGDPPAEGATAEAFAEVRAGLLVGLVADAVGQGLGGAELDWRLGTAVQAVEVTTGWRQRVRLDWVTGEIAMLAGRWDSAGRTFARGRNVAARAGGRRHEAKSAVFSAAAAVAAGDLHGGAREAERAQALAGALGAMPLVWPALLVRADAAAAGGADEAAAGLRAEARDALAPLLLDLPEPLRRFAYAQSPASWLLPPVG